jgi:hypothetical protein
VIAARPALTLRGAAIGALMLTVVLGAISDLLFVAAFQFRPEWLSDPARLVAGGAPSAELLKWAALADMFSYYLPSAVVALTVWMALRRRGAAVADAATLAAFGYVLAGSVGAAMLATVGPLLMSEYAQPGAQQAALAALFGALTDVVFRAIWQLVDGVLIGVWMVGIGLLMRTDQPAFARTSIVLGALFWASTALNVAGEGLARDATLGVVFVLWAAWSIWLAMLLWRHRSPFGDAGSPIAGSAEFRS